MIYSQPIKKQCFIFLNHIFFNMYILNIRLITKFSELVSYWPNASIKLIDMWSKFNNYVSLVKIIRYCVCLYSYMPKSDETMKECISWPLNIDIMKIVWFGLTGIEYITWENVRWWIWCTLFYCHILWQWCCLIASDLVA